MTDITQVLTERGSEYGVFERHATITQEFKKDARAWAVNQNMSDDQWEALDMIFHKIGRILNGNPHNVDSWVDIAGYAKLVADRLSGVVR